MYLLEIPHSLTFREERIFVQIYVGKPKDIYSLVVVGFLLFKILLDQALTQVVYTILGDGFSLLF